MVLSNECGVAVVGVEVEEIEEGFYYSLDRLRMNCDSRV